MTKYEAIVVSAYTGFLMCDFNDMHEYIEKKLGRPIYTHEFALDLVQKEIHEKVKPDFLKICAEVQELVRCGECKYYDDPQKCIVAKVAKLKDVDRFLLFDANWFCADGKRKVRE